MYFLSGLPRSGNTLLASLLNQHPDIYCSPLSPLLQSIDAMENAKNYEESQIVDFDQNIANGIKSYVKDFYKDCQKPIVIDRNKAWGCKESIFYAYKYITDTPKFIYTVRDIPSILTSFLTVIKDETNNFIDNELKVAKMYPYGLQTQSDLRCDWLMSNQVQKSLVALTELIRLSKSFYLVEYDSLIKKPQEELNAIYDFLEVDHYNNDFSNIEKIEIESLEAANLPSSLHDVRPMLKKTSYCPETILTNLTLKKYSGLEFWRN